MHEIINEIKKSEASRQFEKLRSLIDQLLTELEKIELRGSEKQVKWANDLRAKFFCDLSRAKNVAPAAIPVIVKFFAKKTDAKYWIDARPLDVISTLVQHKDELNALIASKNN